MRTLDAPVCLDEAPAISVPADRSRIAKTGSRRRITPMEGRALEKLGHAIEYITDEFVNNPLEAHQKATLEAVQILMAANRSVYYSCPEVPTFRARLRRFLGWGG